MNGFGKHANQVMSDLRNAVGVADDKIIHLQRELDLLERKANSEGNHYKTSYLTSNTSELGDDELEQYLEEYADTTADGNLSSLNSSQVEESLDTPKTMPTKLYAGDNHVETNNTDKKRVLKTIQRTLSENGTPVPKKRSAAACNSKNIGEYHRSSNMRGNFLKGSTTPEHLFQERLEEHAEKSTPKSNGIDTESLDNLQSEGEEEIEQQGTSRGRFPHKRLESKDQKKFSILDPDSKPTETYYSIQYTSEPFAPQSEHDDTTYEDSSEAFAENEELQRSLDKEKKKNEKLTEKIMDLEKDLTELQLKYELQAHEQSTGKVVVLVDEIQKAQKLRENAMMERLRIAAQDRDEAILRTKALHVKNLHLQKKGKDVGGRPEKRDKTLAEILDRISTAESGRIIEKYGEELLERIGNLRGARDRITAEEMGAVIKERDEALAKCRGLEQELRKCVDNMNELKRSQDISLDVSLKARVASTEQEKIQTEEKLHTAEEEIQMLRIYYSLHKSLTLTQDQELADRYNGYMESIRSEAGKRAQRSKLVEAENEKLKDKLSHLTEQKRKADEGNENLWHEIATLKEKCGKLERLVKVLRRKLVNNVSEQLTRSSSTHVEQKATPGNSSSIIPHPT